MDYEIWADMQRRVYHRQIHSVDELNGRSPMSAAVLNSRFLTKLLTSGEEDFECVSTLKEDTTTTASELTVSVDFIDICVTCLTVASLITKSYTSNVGQYIFVHFTG